ncbi:hypothetical protein Tco_1556596 [Tanacetum coccineum]
MSPSESKSALPIPGKEDGRKGKEAGKNPNKLEIGGMRTTKGRNGYGEWWNGNGEGMDCERRRKWRGEVGDLEIEYCWEGRNGNKCVWEGQGRRWRGKWSEIGQEELSSLANFSRRESKFEGVALGRELE